MVKLPKLAMPPPPALVEVLEVRLERSGRTPNCRCRLCPRRRRCRRCWCRLAHPRPVRPVRPCPPTPVELPLTVEVVDRRAAERCRSRLRCRCRHLCRRHRHRRKWPRPWWPEPPSPPLPPAPVPLPLIVEAVMLRERPGAAPDAAAIAAGRAVAAAVPVTG